MVSYIRSDLEFILKQIKIAEAHATGQPLYGEGGLIPSYNIAWGLRTVDGSNNHLLPGQEQWGAADREFTELLTPEYRTVTVMMDPDGNGPLPTMPVAMPYTPGNDVDGPGTFATPGDVIDPDVRTISNLIVDQTLANPAAILTALQLAGVDDPGMAITAQISAAFAPLKPLFKTLGEAERAEAEAAAAAAASPDNAVLQQQAAAAAAALAAAQAAVDDAAGVPGGLSELLAANGIEMDGSNLHIPNTAPDEGLSAPFNSWFTLFGQFFDHGLDLVNKGGSGTVMIPLQPDDPLYVEGSNTNFMVLTRATVSPGQDGIWGTADDTRPLNTTTPYVDQNQTYTSHPSHQVFLRQYVATPNGPAATGNLIEGANGGMATWGELKAQAANVLGILLTDQDVGKVPLLRTDPYGNFIPGANGYPQIIVGIGGDGIPNTADDVVVEGNPADPIDLFNVYGVSDPEDPTAAIRTNHAFLADIAHTAVPTGLADGDITIGLENPGNEPGVYDNELLDAHFIAGDGRVNENIGLTAVHHVFHSEHNRLVEHTKEVALADAAKMLANGSSQAEAVAFLNEWLDVDVATVPVTPAAIGALVWDGERLFQAAKFGTEMQYQHLVFEEFARKIQPAINTFLVPDGFDTTLDPTIFAEFAHVVYRFGHSMLTESIDQFDGNFVPNHISLIQGFLNPTAFTSPLGVDDGIAAGAIIRGMTRQVGNEIDEFVTSALRNNLLGLPLDLATINLARGRDTGVPSLNAARADFYEASNQNILLKPYESWVDFAGNLKHEASIINFIAAYGTHETIVNATTLEEKRDAAMALVGLTTAASETVALSNASFEADSLAAGSPNVISDPAGNYTLTAPSGWAISGTGGLFDPAAGVINQAAIDGTNVVWLGQGGVLSRDTGLVLEENARYSLSFDIGDPTYTSWPGGVARLVSSDGTVLAELPLPTPTDGNWSTVTLETAAIGLAVAGQTLTIEIEQSASSDGEILIDDVQLDVLRPLATLDEDDRQAFLNGTGAYAVNRGGLDLVDLWIGGLAEKTMPFGGMLGSTFNFVFEVQMELLQSGDRFYYLQRLDGLHLFGEMENNSFASMIMRNTNATHLPSDVFSTPGLILEVDQSRQFNDLDGDGILESTDPTGGGILTQLVVRSSPDNLRYNGDDHVILGGTEANNVLIGGIGDDTLFGDGGNDRLDGGFGNDIINGGDGDDIIVDAGGDDNIKAGAGNDVVHAGPGLDLVLAGSGKDFVFLGTDEGSEVFAGEGDDFIYGNKNAERILGNEGNDWIETGTFDGAPGDNFDEIFAHDGIDGHDVFLGDGGFDEFIGEGGDDVMVGSAGRGKMVGMSGWDWATYKDNTSGVNADLSIPIIFDEAPTLPQNAALDAYESVEALSGSKFNDVLKGAETLAEERLPGGSEGFRGSQLTRESIQLINGLAAVLGLTEAQVNAMVAGQVVFNAGDIILGGDGSDTIQGNAGDDILDGDKWLNVRISVRANPDGTGPEIESHNSMTTLASKMFSGQINPGQLVIVREILTDTTTGDTDTAVYRGLRTEYAFSATADGQVIVTHAVEDSLDGSDKLRNIEKVQFSDGNALNIFVGTDGNDTLDGTAQDDLMLGLGGSDVLNGGAGNDILVGGPNSAITGGTFLDDFGGTASYTDNNGPLLFNGGWVESGGETPTSPTGGDININGNRLRFQEGIDGGETITRAANLTGYNSAVLSFAWEGDDLDAGETVSVQAFNGTTWDTLTSLGGDGSGNFSQALTAAQIGAHTAIRFVANGTFEGGENFFVDNVNLAVAVIETLNGGLGNDTYSFTVGDGSDFINEGVNATSGGTADRISILAPSTGTDPETGLPILTITSLSANDSNTGTQNGDLTINYTLPTGSQQTITVAGHFTGTNAETGVELINFNSAIYAGYQLGAGHYAVSRADPTGSRTLNLTASTANNFVAGENGTEDAITGGSGNDLIFGGSGDNDLVGGLGADLLVGGADDDSLDARNTGDPDNLDLIGAGGADTMIGGGGNDTYGVDDLLDVVVEAAGGGTDTVETFMDALSLENMANVENLSYEGGDADQFVGTGNGGNNVIFGGDLNDTLSGLGGNDTLNGGLGADNMNGGDGNDVYDVDETGDVVTETSADSIVGGVDRVESDINYTLGANVENLDLNGTAVIGTGNALNNVINGNDENNQLFGAVGDDTLNGGDGSDLLDGGMGNDTLNGGDDNDTITGGAGDDTIDVGGGVNTIVYNTAGFGNDVINSFDATGGTPATQDRVDLSALGITAANFATRVTIEDVADAGTDDTRVTVRDASNAIIGTIFIEEVDGNDITITDFTLASTGAPLGGATTGNNTLNGTAGNDIINALAGNDTVNGNAGNDLITGGPGNDFVNGNDGDDMFVWNANAAAPTDGRDEVDGGAEGAVGDTFVINGNASAETYRIFTRAAWDALPGNIGASLDNDTEIVITRNGTDFTSVIAELWDVEEIRINGSDPAGGGSTASGDTIEVIGDFSATSLRPNTITIEGDAGDDTVDISSLGSAHRIVFKSNGGNDTIIGALRPDDVIELPDGANIGDYVETVVNGVTTLTRGDHSITFTATGEGPHVGEPDDREDDDGNDGDHGSCGDDDDDGDGAVVPPPASGSGLVGTEQADALTGTSDGETIMGLGGRDVVFGHGGGDDILGGGGADMLYGDGGDDRILGENGNDFVNGGSGRDTVFGGNGDDIIVAQRGDGDDTYYGDDMVGGNGNDTLDMSAITAAITADLGTGFLGRGSVSSIQTGSDTIWGIENIVTGSGNDRITANGAVNVIDGGGGGDVFRFLSAAHADGDTILGFEPGDKIDLSAMDANGCASGNQSFTLVSDAFTGRGQLMVTHETRDGEDYTVVEGNTTGGPDADFKLSIKGSHELMASDFNL